MLRAVEDDYDLRKHDIRDWVEEISGVKFASEEDWVLELDNGVTLCKLLAGIDASIAPKFREKPIGMWGKRDNISLFLDVVRHKLDVDTIFLFEITDLVDAGEGTSAKNEKNVINCLNAMAKTAHARFGTALPGTTQADLEVEAEEEPAENEIDQILRGVENEDSEATTPLNQSIRSASSAHSAGPPADATPAQRTIDLHQPAVQHSGAAQHQAPADPAKKERPRLPKVARKKYKAAKGDDIDEAVAAAVRSREQMTDQGLVPGHPDVRIVRIKKGQYLLLPSRKVFYMRILRGQLMVRVGGGWQAFDQWLDHLKHFSASLQARTVLTTKHVEERERKGRRKSVPDERNHNTNNNNGVEKRKETKDADKATKSIVRSMTDVRPYLDGTRQNSSLTHGQPKKAASGQQPQPGRKVSGTQQGPAGKKSSGSQPPPAAKRGSGSQHQPVRTPARRAAEPAAQKQRRPAPGAKPDGRRATKIPDIPVVGLHDPAEKATASPRKNASRVNSVKIARTASRERRTAGLDRKLSKFAPQISTRPHSPARPQQQRQARKGNGDSLDNTFNRSTSLKPPRNAWEPSNGTVRDSSPSRGTHRLMSLPVWERQDSYGGSLGRSAMRRTMSKPAPKISPFFSKPSTRKKAPTSIKSGTVRSLGSSFKNDTMKSLNSSAFSATHQRPTRPQDYMERSHSLKVDR